MKKNIDYHYTGSSKHVSTAQNFQGSYQPRADGQVKNNDCYLCKAVKYLRESCLYAHEFSRKLRRKVPLFHCQTAFLLLNSLENSSTSGLLPLLACHPSVTLVTLQKGCKCPVYRHSVTLSPYIEKILVWDV